MFFFIHYHLTVFFIISLNNIIYKFNVLQNIMFNLDRFKIKVILNEYFCYNIFNYDRYNILINM